MNRFAAFFHGLFLATGMFLLVPGCGGTAHREPLPDSSMRVDNFGLFDHEGSFHRLHYYTHAKAVVMYIHGNGCPIVRNGLSTLNSLRDKYEAQGVKFFMLNANLQDHRASIREEAEAYGIDMPILIDESQLVAEALDVTRTAEALVIDPATWTIQYRGPVDDRLGYEAQRKEAKAHYLADALDAVLDGRPIAEAVIRSPGCLVALPNKEATQKATLTYTEDIAPILKARCQQCHQPGGIAPWAMTGYDIVRGWSPMIREVVRTRRMPPWQADPHVGNFQNDLSITVEEMQKIVHWVEAGAPKGSGEDPLKDLPEAPASWTLGEPDIEIELAQQQIPATGVLDYRYQEVPLELDEGKWVKAVEVLPGNRASLHHALVSVTYPQGYEPPVKSRNRWLDGIFSAYAPGAEPEVFPEGTGRFLPKGSKLLFQLHYTTTGKEEVDQTRFGIYFDERTPDREYFVLGPFNTNIAIQPGVSDYTAYSEQEFPEKVTLYGMFPHMHFRGKSMKYEAIFPDGKRQTLLNVPYYNFNWQRNYLLEEPVVLPGGSKIVVEAVFDNSSQNPFNPDPSATVHWGDQSFDEMLIGYMSLVKGEPAPQAFARK